MLSINLPSSHITLSVHPPLLSLFILNHPICFTLIIGLFSALQMSLFGSLYYIVYNKELSNLRRHASAN